MTTIVYRDGVMAADSRATVDTEAGGARMVMCDKLFRVGDAIIGTAGDGFASLLFVDWYRFTMLEPDKDRADELASRLLEGEADIDMLVLRKDGLFEFDKWCRAERIKMPFYAVGSGAKAALGALHMGADARQAVAVACKIDPYSAPPIVTMSLRKARAPQRGGARAPRQPSR